VLLGGVLALEAHGLLVALGGALVEQRLLLVHLGVLGARDLAAHESGQRA
jgi:hypothetical protein